MATGVALSFIVPILFSLFLMVGVAIAVRGIIGLPVWRAPRCASCGHGIAPRPESLRSACPECGADLSSSTGVHYFARQRRYGRVVAGLAVTGSSLGLVVIIRLVLWLTVPPAVGSSTPAATLADQIRAGEGLEMMAISEAANRLLTGTLTDNDLTTLIEALRPPPASEHDRFPKYGELDLLLEARRRKLIDDEDLIEFGRGFMLPPSLQIPTTFRIPFTSSIPSIPNDQFNAFSRSTDVMKLEIDGADVPIVDPQGQRMPRVGWGNYGQASIDGPPGNHTLRVTYQETFVFGPDRATSTLVPVRLVADRVIETPLTYVAPNAPSWIGMASPADRRAEVEAACVVTALAIDPSAAGETYTLRAKFQVHAVRDLALSFDIVVRLDEPKGANADDMQGAEHVVGTMAVFSYPNGTTSAGPNERAVTLPSRPHHMPTSATVIFRPAPAHAERLVGVNEVWGEEITVPNVPVRAGGAR